ncbi:hypothetical protein LMG28727_00847 [Paraburkholderia kirstenboschensis]|uniref:hypothetical protein n=1 Tax=Paraburkholderia kirstenboschensis TaxID=1245436 RepID=UPI000B19AA7F|nr:hypothetical protein [Paraburkholderia kirstenboschensis]CAD6514131.1 hypothetical protein LMG28727_00847 [Paraburkholderia kirstenboschensis]
MTTQSLENLARARAAHTEAGTSLQAAADANSALLVRLTEARARGEEAVRETKQGGDPAGKWAMQLRLSQDDQADIQNLLSQSQASLNTRNAVLSNATAALRSAEATAHKEEAEIQARELDAVIAELDAKLCQAVQARLACHLASNPRAVSRTSVFTLYSPSKMLKSICLNGQVG